MKLALLPLIAALWIATATPQNPADTRACLADNGIVMLKNDDSLPLSKGKIAILGNAGEWQGLKDGLGRRARFVSASDSRRIAKAAAVIVVLNHADTATDSATVLRAAANADNVVVVATSPQLTDFSPWVYRVRGIIALLRQPDDGGKRLANIILGKENPAARLPFAIPLRRDGVGAPLFPFGFGRSYTSFAYSSPTAEPLGGGRARVTFTLKNCGDTYGTETAQIYITPQGAYSTPAAGDLKACRKVGLNAGESATVVADLPAAAFGPQKNDGDNYATYKIQIGPYCDDLPLQTAISPR